MSNAPRTSSNEVLEMHASEDRIALAEGLRVLGELPPDHVVLIEAMSRQIEERYAPKMEQADQVLRTVPVGVTVQDARGNLLYANETAARLCGYASPAALIASPAGAILSRFALLDESGAAFPPELLPGHRVLSGEEPDPELAINVWHDVTDEQRKKESGEHLNELTASLVKTLDFEQRLDKLADDLVPRIADWCAIDLVEDGVRQPLVVRGTKPALKEATFDVMLPCSRARDVNS